MGKFIDLTGQRFGKLVVIERAENYVSPKGAVASRWLCRCDCGNKKIIFRSSLIKGKTISCGCYKKEKDNKPKTDLTGKTFNRLTVIEYVKNGKWLCKCECGNISIAKGSDLKNEIVKSCGCYANELLRERTFQNLTGMRFGKLVVLHQIEDRIYNKKTHFTQWLCQCDCGNKKTATSSALKSGLNSCGCIPRKRDGELAAIKEIYRTYQRGAKDRGFIFSIDFDKFKKIISDDCYYCGVKPSQKKRIRKGGGILTGYFLYNGIDRKDNNDGYIDSNIVPCCYDCNRAKMKKSQQDFLSWVERVYNHSIKGEKND